MRRWNVRDPSSKPSRVGFCLYTHFSSYSHYQVVSFFVRVEFKCIVFVFVYTKGSALVVVLFNDTPLSVTVETLCGLSGLVTELPYQ
jgi:hypothetical protein